MDFIPLYFSQEPKGSAEVKAEEAENSTYYKLFVSKSNRRVAVGGDFDRQRASEVAWVAGK